MNNSAIGIANDGAIVATPHPTYGLPPYTPETAGLYDALLVPGTCGVVAADTGGGKTLLLCQLAAYAAMQGKRVGFACLDMMPSDVLRRVFWILADESANHAEDPFCRMDSEGTPDGEKRSDEVIRRIRAIKVADYTIERATAIRLATDLPLLAQHVDLLIVDGIESISGPDGATANIAAGMGVLAQLAMALPGLVVWTTSQIRREAMGVEIVTGDELGVSLAKVQRSSVVVTLGQRERDQLWTACIAKDRNHGVTAERQVYRFVLTPALRLEFLPVIEGVLPMTADISEGGQFTFIGPGRDLPDEDDDTDAGRNVHMSPSTSNTPWHGKNGYVGFGREVFHSDVFLTRQYDHWYWLCDLYAQAHNVPEPGVLMAPGTRVAVRLQRGDVMVSLEILAKRWDCTPKRVRTFLDHMVRAQLIRMWHIRATGAREEYVGRSGGMPNGRRGSVVATVITLCHYRGEPKRKGKAREKVEGRTMGTPNGMLGACEGHTAGRLRNKITIRVKKEH